MARPRQFRILSPSSPAQRLYLPDGVFPESADLSNLRVEELEALRLADVEGLDQEQAARKMHISRQTFGRLLTSARRTVAKALIAGRGLSIGGGVYQYQEKEGRLTCPYCSHSQPALPELRQTVRCRRCSRPVQTYHEHPSSLQRIEEPMDFRNARIAVASDDGQNVSSHFGRAPYYAVITLQEGAVVARERRDKFAPHGHAGAAGEGEHPHGPHEHKHAAMAESIRDCQAVVARGMGDGAYIHLTSAGLTTILTSLHTVDEVAEAAAGGMLEHQEKRVHHHGQLPL
ncbi:DUF134 domain-containing protein [bacterium]|nr:MAG: DUF134 domain-containing protein [bacterium]